MALIVEDDTGLSTAEAYVSVTDADTFILEHYGTSEAAWDAATDAVKEQALRRATRYLDQTYKYVGIRLALEQALEWPRSGAYEQTSSFEVLDGVPQSIKDASVELALMVINDVTLFPVTTEGGNVKKERVGPIEVEYSEKSVNREPIFHMIDAIVRYIVENGNQVLRS